MTTDQPVTTPTVRKVTAGETAAVARTLARAFRDDPFILWQLDGDARRPRILVRGFRLFLEKVWLVHDECWTTDDLTGAALWEPPGTWKLGTAAQLRLMPAMLAAFGRYLPRTLRTFDTMEQHHPHEPHFYLPILGVDPDRQGQGLGSALLRTVLDRCDHDGLGAYLESTSPRNRALYERHGFVTTRELRVADDAPPLSLMWRDPVDRP